MGAEESTTKKAGGLGGMLAGLKKDKESKGQMYELEKSLVRNDEDTSDNHYVWMEFTFNDQRLWVWWINLAAYIAVVTTYFCIEGHEIIYLMYLPLDMFMNLSKAVYFFYNYYDNIQEKKKQQELVTSLQNKIKEGLKNIMMKNKNKDGDEGDEKKETSQIELQYRKTMQL